MAQKQLNEKQKKEDKEKKEKTKVKHPEVHKKIVVMMYQSLIRDLNMTNEENKNTKEEDNKSNTNESTQPVEMRKSSIPIFSKAPVMNKSGYFMVPSISELRELEEDKLNNIKSLTIGKSNIGKIEWKDVDVRNINFDINVIINEKNIEVYPDGTLKPAEGEKLNKPATITYFGGLNEMGDKELDSFVKKHYPYVTSYTRDDSTKEVTIEVDHF
ncbi:nucleoporin autopeptidase, putative [Entamoeba histolytica HM-1:IMSS-B]|nr:nucleoporin autopeptidase, putative [Entamoeba histolytica HM-1:IMSS-B]